MFVYVFFCFLLFCMCVPFARLRELFPLPLNVGSASFSTVCFPTSRQRKLGLGRGILLQLFSIYYFTFVFFSFVIRYNCCVFFLFDSVAGRLLLSVHPFVPYFSSLFFVYCCCLMLLLIQLFFTFVLCVFCVFLFFNASMCHPRLHVLGVCGLTLIKTQ